MCNAALLVIAVIIRLTERREGEVGEGVFERICFRVKTNLKNHLDFTVPLAVRLLN